MEDSQQPIIHSSYYYKGTTGVQPSPSLLGEPLTYYPSVGAGPSNTSHQIQPHFQHSIHPPYDVFSGQVPQTFAIEGHITDATGLQTSKAPHAGGEASDPDPELETRLAEYELAIQTVFTDILSGRLDKAGQQLLEESEWLLGHVEELREDQIIDHIHTLTLLWEGLHIDNTSLYRERIELWDKFNHAWMALFTKQEDILDLGEGKSREYSLLSTEDICKMADRLIEMCDGISKHGLVNYQYDVWEDDIITVLLEYMDLQDELHKTRPPK